MNQTVSQKKKINSNKNYIQSKTNKLYMIPLILIIGIIPMIVRFREYNTGLSRFNWFSKEDGYFDMFLYYKQIYFLIICSVALILIIYRIFQSKNKGKLKLSVNIIPLMIYGLFALLSTIFSKYASFGYTGIFEQFESVFVLLGYCIIVYYAFIYIDSEENINLIFRFFLYCVLLLGFLGLMQAAGHDFFSSDTGLRSILPRAHWNELNDFEFKFGKNCSYLTLYNPNYAGVYVALVAPVFTCLMLTEKVTKKKLLYLVAIIELLISLYGSKSGAGMIGIAVALFFILIFMRNYIFIKSKIMIPILIIAIGAVVVISAWKFNSIKNMVSSIISTNQAQPNLTDIKTDKDIVITYKGNDLTVKFSENPNSGLDFSMTDKNGTEVSRTANTANNSLDITDERFTGISVSLVSYEDKLCASIKIDGKDWMFSYNKEDNSYYYINMYGRYEKIVKADSALFTGHESIATGRGYLWSRTIPLLKKYLILGSGADTFAIVFPQNDYVNLYNYGFSEELVTKPHSLYLQIGVQTGVISLIAFLIFYGMYFVSSIGLYIKGKFDTVYSKVGVAVFIGTVTYMVTGLTNDSCIAVSPVFWGLIGIGIAVNYNLKMKNKNNN